ncbi:hypothetical protein OK351_13685 [Glutamicibacter sp. MNS18]|uniref:hypothetical protein n=1 Tax=Glutamicibacter sp. MNS18 TaxID=2989817 RepID=UPI00223563D8|nr:hypothetical protein [Glutamicibacter sp. MNS18]MCW4466545.1 hypothetical protein [Glutamicibacter sp. MNS18]
MNTRTTLAAPGFRGCRLWDWPVPTTVSPSGSGQPAPEQDDAARLALGTKATYQPGAAPEVLQPVPEGFDPAMVE